MPLAPGTRLGAYEITDLIGAGGMGEVYRARDTKLNRDVAIKVLPDAFAGDRDRLARFKREAQVLASLNHPHIAAIYGLEETTNANALILELVEGPTLADRIARGPIAVDEALAIARQICEGLEAAHERGIIHRDLKPANIKVTADGTVKVLDFGLAKGIETTSGGPPGNASGLVLSQSPTITSPAMTMGGVILGTAAYMSPEQVRGNAVDKRTDIWAFGCVLFEMLTGKRAFQGEDVSDTLAEVIKGEPDWPALPAQTPATLVKLIRRCLIKDRKARLSDAAGLRLDIDEAAATAGRAIDGKDKHDTKSSQRNLLIVGSSALAAGLCIAAVGTWLVMRPLRQGVGETMRFPISLPSGLAPSTAGASRVTISPDGRRLAYVISDAGTAPRLMVRSMDSGDVQELQDGVSGPIFSPDSKWIAFAQGPELRRMSLAGGPSMRICALNGILRGAVWGADDTIIFATNDRQTGLLQVSARGGEPKQLTKPSRPDEDHWFPAILPGGKHVLFTTGAAVLSSEKAQISVVGIDGRDQKVLVPSGSNPYYVGTGHLLYVNGQSLVAVRFDPVRLQVLSDPVAVIDRLATTIGGAGEFGISDSGILTFVPVEAGIFRSLVWVDRRGNEQPAVEHKRAYHALRLSPDETRVAVDIRDRQNDIWTLHLEKGSLTQLTFNPGADVFPVWSNSGDRILFGSARGGPENIYSQAADGTDDAVPVISSATRAQFPMSVSPDDKYLVLWEPRGSAENDIHMLQMDGRSQPSPLITARLYQGNADLSPNGRLIAYQSNETGEDHVYVRPFPDVDSGRWRVSPAGGTQPVWSRDGTELFFLGPDHRGLYVVPVRTHAATFSSGDPVPLFKTQYFSALQGRSYDVSRDGKRFLMIKDTPVAGEKNEPVASIVVVVNWFEELKRLVPTN